MSENKVDEIVFTVPLWKAYKTAINKRAKRAISVLKEEVLKRVKGEEANIVVDQIINQKIWKRGIRKPPRKILIKVRKQEDGKILITLP
ncbi:MAG: 50S ribosomal protein L31e [Nitrososphaeria archaeon]|nr:50S ribosomal protein L31e [Nitrososphaeria archaeon]